MDRVRSPRRRQSTVCTEESRPRAKQERRSEGRRRCRGGGGAGERARVAKGRRGRANRLASLGRQKRRRALLASRHHVVASHTKHTAAEEHLRRLGRSAYDSGVPARRCALRLGFRPSRAPASPWDSLPRGHDEGGSTRCVSVLGGAENTVELATGYASVRMGSGAAQHRRLEAHRASLPGCLLTLSKVRTRVGVHHVYYHSFVLPRLQWAYLLRRGAVTARSSPAAREESQLGACDVRFAGSGLQTRETAGHSKVCTRSREHRGHCHLLALFRRSPWALAQARCGDGTIGCHNTRRTSISHVGGGMRWRRCGGLRMRETICTYAPGGATSDSPFADPDRTSRPEPRRELSGCSGAGRSRRRARRRRCGTRRGRRFRVLAFCEVFAWREGHRLGACVARFAAPRAAHRTLMTRTGWAGDQLHGEDGRQPT